ncbi:phage tail tip fiber protein, partial [Klebsiella michiganensis]|uniref:phage tail tip fiber protein n=1 Tax=Klebsiella michiganensis TaxID=1134687 RepID=UPI003DA807B7
DITDAQDALNVADASTTAVNSLTTRVTDAENKITAQSQQLTSLQSSLNGKADAGALNSLTSRVTSAEGKITSTANSLTSLNSTVGTLSSTVQAQGNTLVDTNNKISSMYSIKVETNNEKKVGAGIVLGSDGSTSDMILYADRFSLFNRNSKTAVPVMIAEGNELYIDSARIKNGSIDTAKIKDATITSAKIAGALNSVNYDWATGKTGWCLNMNGDMMLNNGTFRGHIEATSGTFKGAVEANSFVGDIAAMGVFPAFNGNVKSRLIHHDTSNKGGKSFCIQGIVRWIAGNERSTIGIECWVNGQRVSRITFNTSDIGSSLIGYLPFQGTKTGISTQDTLVEVVITNSISASLVSGTCIMSRGSGNWENIG